MRELKNGTMIIRVDHGYGNIKTANTIMPTGITAHQTAPTFDGNILIYNGVYLYYDTLAENTFFS